LIFFSVIEDGTFFDETFSQKVSRRQLAERLN